MRHIQSDATEAIESVGHEALIEFRIAHTRESMDNWLNSIYSRKEETVVRELIANALDSHQEAGHPERAVEVHLPTILERNFIVRDFGVGMSDDFVRKLYSLLNHSTKTDDNQQTGMFGVGSKSPLSVTDSFTVRCFERDELRIYDVVRPTTGFAGIMPARKVSGDYERGVEVIVPVAKEQTDDFFKAVASQQAIWHDKAVKWVGLAPEAVDDIRRYTVIRPLIDRLLIAAPNDNVDFKYATRQLYVRQGSAIYPCDLGRNPLFEAIFKSGYDLILDVPIGTCAVTIARENLQYNDATRQQINAYIDAARKAIQDVLNRIAGQPPRLAFDALMYVFFPDASDYGAEAQMVGKLLEHVPNIVYPHRMERISVRRAVEKKFLEANPTALMLPIDFPGSGDTFFYTFRAHRAQGSVVVTQAERDASKVSLTIPSRIFIISRSHSHWRQRFSILLREQLKNDPLPGSAESGLKIIVISSLKAARQAVLDYVKSAGFGDSAAVIDQLPALTDAQKPPPRDRRTVMHMEKVDATGTTLVDFSDPAGFLYYTPTRHRNSRVYDPAGLKVHHSRMKSIVQLGRSLGAISADPVYLVSDKRAAWRAKKAPHWIDTATTLHAFAQTIDPSPFVLFQMDFLSDWNTDPHRGVTDGSDAVLGDLVKRAVKEDDALALYLAVMATRHDIAFRHLNTFLEYYGLAPKVSPEDIKLWETLCEDVWDRYSLLFTANHHEQQPGWARQLGFMLNGNSFHVAKDVRALLRKKGMTLFFQTHCDTLNKYRATVTGEPIDATAAA